MTNQPTLVAYSSVATAGFETFWVFVCFGSKSEDHAMTLVFASDSVSGFEVYRHFVNLVKVCLAGDQRGVESDMTCW